MEFKNRLWKIQKTVWTLGMIAAAVCTGTFPGCTPSVGPGSGTNLEISVGQSFTISKKIITEEITGKEWWQQHGDWGYWCFPLLRKCPDGSLLLSFSTGADAFMATQSAPSLYRSRDKGRTWRPDPMGKIGSLSPRVRDSFLHFNGREPLYGMGLAGYTSLSDGTAVAFFYHAMKDVSPGTGPDQYVTSLWRSSDGGKTWDGPVDSNLIVPGNAKDPLGRGPAIWHRSVEMKNGRLLTTAHTLFEGDKKLRIILLESADKGRNWCYLATVAHDPDLNVEGFTEPILCKLANEELICFIRTEGIPMHQVYSSDGGKTWSKTVESGAASVAPDMHLLSNGVLACSYGRPGVNIVFDANGNGRTWTHRTEIYNRDNTTSYTGFEEVSPGRILLIYDTQHFKDDPSQVPANCIRGVYIDVKRTKK